MTRSARYSPFSLRGHPIVMVLMVFYHVADLAGVFAKRAH